MITSEKVRDWWEQFVDYVFDSPWTTADNPIGDALAYVAAFATLLAALPLVLIWLLIRRVYRLVVPSRHATRQRPGPLRRRFEYRGADTILQGASLLAAIAWWGAFALTWLVYGAATGSLHWDTSGGRGGPVVDTEHPNLPEWTVVVFWFVGAMVFGLATGYLAVAVNSATWSKKTAVRVGVAAAVTAVAIALPIAIVLYVFGTIF